MRRTLAAVLLGSAAVIAASFAAAGESPAPLKTKITAVSLFKNGLGFIAREGALPKGEATVLVDGLPVPVHGTVWVSARGDGTALTDVVAFERDDVVQVPARTVAELLAANVGETVEVRRGDVVVRGKLVAVPETPVPRLPRSAPRYAMASVPAEAASLALFETPGGMVGLNRNTIEQVTGVGGPLKTTVARTNHVATLRARAANATGTGRLVVAYLARGISWAPSYVIDIADPTTARITAKAEIVNDIEDLDNAAVKLVTGYPNIQFAEVNDPIGLREDLAGFLTSLATPPDSRRAWSGVAVMAQRAGPSPESVEPGISTAPLTGQAAEDLFFYEQKGVSLKKGERGYYALLTVGAPYRHVYEWKVPDTLDEWERPSTDEARDAHRGEEVWHTLRLTNTGRLPWTTAPAMTVQGTQPLGQDILYYTSTGDKTSVRITRAMDVKAERTELEVDRKPHAATFFRSSYALLTIRGRLKVTNFKDKDVTVAITKDLSGEVVTTSPVGTVQQLAKALRHVNPHSQISWELPIKSRDKTEIEYTYRVYVRD